MCVCSGLAFLCFSILFLCCLLLLCYVYFLQCYAAKLVDFLCFSVAEVTCCSNQYEIWHGWLFQTIFDINWYNSWVSNPRSSKFYEFWRSLKQLLKFSRCVGYFTMISHS